MADRIAALIPLAPRLLRDTDPAELHRRLQRILRSNRFEVVRTACGFRILGPDVAYHAHDPFLRAGLTRLHPALRPEGAQAFRTSTAAFDLCLEDSWSGWFVAEWLSGLAPAGDLVFIHLDHHTDMMSSLLEWRGAVLYDPVEESVFDPRSSVAWRKGIATGSIGIGSFVTTLFELPNLLHVRHVNNRVSSDYRTYGVTRAARTYPEIPGRSFACIRKRRHHPAGAIGSYRGGCDPARVLADTPPGRVVVHIDLDYLINDFNGNARPSRWAPAADARDGARRKVDTFFAALGKARLGVDRWIVATSPGFCSAYHWPWLLDLIARRIEGFALATLGSSAVAHAWPSEFQAPA